MVQNSQWGPPLWRILHSIAARLGRQTLVLLAEDERRTWKQMLRTVEAIMPCPLCRKHYREWRRDRPVETAVDGHMGESLSQEAQRWLWNLHEAVNQRREVPGMDWSEVQLLYRARTSQDLDTDIHTLVAVLRDAILQRSIDAAALRDWQKQISMLRRMTGI